MKGERGRTGSGTDFNLFIVKGEGDGIFNLDLVAANSERWQRPNSDILIEGGEQEWQYNERGSSSQILLYPF